MRQVNDRARVELFMGEVGREVRGHGSIYFVGGVDFSHSDMYGQAFAKLSRGHERDLQDVEAMFAAGHVEPATLQALVLQRADQLGNYSNLQAEAQLQRIAAWVAEHGG